MSDEKEGNRINIEDLPSTESELSTEEAKDVKGGAWHELVILGDVAAARKSTTNPVIDPATDKPKTSP